MSNTMSPREQAARIGDSLEANGMDSVSELDGTLQVDRKMVEACSC